MKYESEVREEMGQLETLLAASKRDYELLRIEFERKAAADEQAAPLAKLGCLTSLSLSLSHLLSPPLSSSCCQGATGDSGEPHEDNWPAEE